MSKLIVCGEPDELKQLPVVNPPNTRRIDITCEHVTSALQVLRRLPGVRSATIFGQSMHFLVDQNLPDESVRAELQKAGISHVDIRPIGPSLEDVFVALTKEKEGDGATT